MISLHLLLLVAQTFPSPGPKNGPTASSLTSVITSMTPGTTRHDFPGAAGIQFKTVGSSINVQQVGRWCVSGNALTHTLYMTDAGATTVLGSASVNMAGCTPNTFVYAALSLTLSANTVYNLLSTETTSGGDDDWLQQDESSIVTTSVIINTGLDLVSGGSNFLASFSSAVPPNLGISTTSGAGKMYVGVSFKY